MIESRSAAGSPIDIAAADGRLRPIEVLPWLAIVAGYFLFPDYILLGYQTLIALAPDERIQNVAVGDSGASRWAQGGIAAAVEEGDTPESHAKDTVAAGAGLVDHDIALGMAREARARVEELAAMGAPALIIYSATMTRSMAGRSPPPNSFGHAMPRKPCAASSFENSFE